MSMCMFLSRELPTGPVNTACQHPGKCFVSSPQYGICIPCVGTIDMELCSFMPTLQSCAATRGQRRSSRGTRASASSVQLHPQRAHRKIRKRWGERILAQSPVPATLSYSKTNCFVPRSEAKKPRTHNEVQGKPRSSVLRSGLGSTNNLGLADKTKLTFISLEEDGYDMRRRCLKVKFTCSKSG